jgi:hypothetical protein
MLQAVFRCEKVSDTAANRAMSVQPAARRGVQTGVVRHQTGVAHAGPARQALHQFAAARHVRDTLRRHEGAGLDVTQACVGQTVDQRQPVVDAQRHAFVLQAVTRTDLDDAHTGRQRARAHDMPTGTQPG